MTRMLFMVATCTVLLAVSAARAAESNDEAKAEFDRGKALFKGEKYDQAADAFRRANQLKPNWKIYFNIGQSEAVAKRHGLALEAFEAYLAQGGDDIALARREDVLAEVERLRKMVGAVTVKAPDAAIVVVDGVERGEAPLPGSLLIAAGVMHRVEVRHDSEAILEREIKVNGGQNVEIVAELKSAPVATTQASEDEDDEAEGPAVDPEKRSPLKIWGFVTLGVGGATLIGGAVTGGMALSQGGDLEKNCPDGECSEEYWDDNNRVDSLATATDVLIGVGATLAVAGATMLIVAYTREEGGELSDTALVPWIGSELGGIAVVRSF